MQFFKDFDLKKIENLELLAKQVVEGFIIGLHKSPFHGFSIEFAEHRLYNPGESTKDIDWKVYGRTDKMFVKKFEEETNLRCQIVIDTSSSMYFKNQNTGLNKVQFSCLAAASLMNLLKKQRDAFGISLFENDLHIHTPAKSGTKHYKLLLNYLEKIIQDKTVNKGTATSSALHQVADRIHKRSLVIIFTDMFDVTSDSEELFSALQHLKFAKHEVIVFHVLDKEKEIEFKYQNRPYLFVDLESKQEIKLQSNQVQQLYKERACLHKEKLKQKCIQYKIDYIESDIASGFYPILRSYFVKRAKMK